MATRPKAVIESRNGEKFSPITITKNVLTDDGQNLHDILSNRKEDMMTPTIENSSSMFKVGQGDNVDYSSNVVNGAYDSCVLKGKTMVNCIQESSSQDVVLPYAFNEGQYVTINDTKESGALGVELKGQTLVNLCQNLGNETSTSTGVLLSGEISVKTNATYMVVAKVKSSNPLSSITLSSFLRVDSVTTGHILGGVTGDITTAYTTKTFTFNTGNTTTVKINLRNAYGDWGLTANTSYAKEVMLIEYQQGMENWDIPYFEGMASCKMPILRTVGKNLFDVKKAIPQANLTIGENYLEYYRENGNAHARFNVPVSGFEIGKHYKYSANVEFLEVTEEFKFNNGLNGYVTEMNYYPTYDNNTGISEGYITAKSTTITFGFHNSNINGAIKTRWSNIQIEEVESLTSPKTTYEPYKSSILSLPEEVILRNIGSVKDTLNLNTGDYIQRIGEVVLDGSEDEKWTLNQISSYTTHTRFEFSLRSNNKPLGIVNTELKCDRFTWINGDVETEHIKIDGGNNRSIFIYIQNSKLATQDVNGLRVWLSQNPTTIQYELETPIVTKINLSSTLKSWNTTTHIYSEIPENTLYPILSHSNPTYPVILKPSTKYSIVANSYSNDHTNSAINFNLGGATASTIVGNRVTTITTPSTLSNELLTMSGRGNKLNNVMVIEGDVVGDEPYFEGVCDCKSPILSNVGKNLFDKTKVKREKYQNYNLANGTFSISSNPNYKVTDYIRVKPNTSYTSRNLGDGAYYTFDKKPITDIICRAANFTVPSNAHYVVLNMSIGQDEDTVGLQEVPSSSLHESYKSNITTFDQKDDKTIVLRSLPSGLCDTLNVETGEYVQRIGEITFDGSNDENWQMLTGNSNWTNGMKNILTFSYPKPSNCALTWLKTGNEFAYLSNKFPSVQSEDKYAKEDKEKLMFDQRDIKMAILKSKLNTQDLVGFKAWLQSNPVTVQYELATPIVLTVDIQGFPHAYTNGHVQLSSGSIEQSLTPKVEYSVVTNRNGQIRSNQKMVERHQKQLDRLQAMILTNLVNTQYEQTLTNLKYDLKNVREEVK